MLTCFYNFSIFHEQHKISMSQKVHIMSAQNARFVPQKSHDAILH